jgi:hypothetical protein
MQSVTGDHCVSGDRCVSDVLHSPNTSKWQIRTQSRELDTKITAHGSWSSLHTHVVTFRWFSKDVWMKWFQSLISEKLLQPKAFRAVDAILNSPFSAVSMELCMKSTPGNSLKINSKTVTIACEDRIEHGDWPLVDHFSWGNLHTPSNYWHPMQGAKTCFKKWIQDTLGPQKGHAHGQANTKITPAVGHTRNAKIRNMRCLDDCFWTINNIFLIQPVY